MAQLFEVVTGPMEGYSVTLEEGISQSLGRSSQNDITLLFDPWISSSHATIKLKGDTVSVMDLHSSNGTYVQGKKIVPDQFIELKEYLILGSTLCRVCQDRPPLTRKPLAAKKATGKPYMQNPLVREALRIARDRRSPTLSVIHLFMAALRTEDESILLFLKSLKLDANSIYARLDKLQIFQGSRDWINDFLIYQYKSKEVLDCYLTPLVQDYLERYAAVEPFVASDFIKRILKEPYSILHPLLGISGQENEYSMPGFTEKVTLNPYDAGDDQIILPKSFWTSFGSMLDRNQPIIFCGSTGSGKTAILKHCFHALPKVDVKHFHKTEKRLFDPEVFLIFNELNGLTPYINRIIKQLRTEELVAIDHFGFLIQLMEGNQIEVGPLIAGIHRRKVPTIISLRSEHLLQVQELLPGAHLLNLDAHLVKVTVDILKKIMLDFETEARCPIGPEAMLYLEKELLNQFNLAAIKAYFAFCGDKIRNMTYLYRDPSFELDRADKQLSKAFFQTAFDHWASPFRAASDHRHPNLSHPVEETPPVQANTLPAQEVHVQDLALRLERVIRRYLEHHLHMDLTYMDGSTSLESRTDQTNAQNELFDYLDQLLGCFGTSFSIWLDTFLAEINPRHSAKTGDETNMGQFLAWFEEIDRDVVRQQFLEITRKTYRRILRQRTIS